MYRALIILICKTVNKLSKLTGHGGSTIGGKIALKLYKNILKKISTMYHLPNLIQIWRN